MITSTYKKEKCNKKVQKTHKKINSKTEKLTKYLYKVRNILFLRWENGCL